jgi:hypothetical protein
MGVRLRIFPLVLALAGCHHKQAEQNAPPLIVGKPGVTVHASQPMVVDIDVKLAHAGSLHVEVPKDPGVHVAKDAGPGTELSVRLRGLMPGTDYVANVTVSDGHGGTQKTDVPFKTLPPLVGFVGHFPVKTEGKASDELRFFDYGIPPMMTRASVFAVDASGTTRYFLPHPAKDKIVAAVPAGLKLLDDGTFMFVQDDHAFILDELGKIVMDIPARQLGLPMLHHDILKLPNGNYMGLSFSFADIFYKFDHKKHHVAGDVIVEFTKEGHVVWEWKTLDHLDPMRIRDGFDSPLPVIDPATHEAANDWTHCNSILYLPGDDSVLLSIRHQDWIIKIDRKTGKVLWKLGDDGDFKLDGDRWFYHQHSPELEPDGSLLIYDNGVSNPHIPIKDQQSRPVRIQLDEHTMTAKVVWEESNQRYASLLAGDADVLENGDVNVLDSWIPLVPGMFQPTFARIREVDPKTKKWVWSMELPNGRFAYRCIHTRRLPGERAH